MDRSELFQLTARLRRAFPRHADVLAICDEAESLSRKGMVPVVSNTEPSEMRPRLITGAAPKRDRAAYMKGYRARRRK